MPQYDSNFNIFKQSMYSRLKGMGYISTLFVLISVIYYEQVIEQALILRPSFDTLHTYTTTLLKSSDEEEIIATLILVTDLEHVVEKSSLVMYDAFALIMILCFFNTMFFISQIL